MIVRAILVLVGWTGFTVSVCAQEWPSTPLKPAPAPLPAPQAAPTPAPDPNAGKQIYGDQPLFEPVVLCEPEPRWRTDVLLGAPTAIRFQRQLGERRLWAEAGAGFYLIWPTVFAGVRSEGPMFNGHSDLLSVRPGLTAYYLMGWEERHGRHWDEVESAMMVALDFDLNWRHRWSSRFHSTFALKLGAGVAFNHNDAVVAPLAGLSIGFNY